MSLLLPLAALTSIGVSKKNALPAHPDSVQTTAPVSAPEVSPASVAPVDAETTVVSSNAVDPLAAEDDTETAAPAPVAEALPVIASPVLVEVSPVAAPEPVVILKVAAPKQTAKPVATAASKKTKPVVSSAPVASTASKLSKPAVEAIPSTPAPSLYDRRTAQVPQTGILGWFGPKADGVRYDTRMIRAAQIAEERARRHSVRSCWRYVKEALLEANVVDTYPQTPLAKQAGDELIQKHGFRRLSIEDPFKAPVGAVLVYGGRGAGHVEIRTPGGFVSDFESPTPSKRPLLGVFVKPS
ncbi:MAG: hypothetical protein WCO68_07020 [Verrucomicrobiota bacterium]